MTASFLSVALLWSTGLPADGSPTTGHPVVAMDRTAALARQINTVHVLIEGVDGRARIDFERALMVQRVEVINAPSTTRGLTTRVEESDFELRGDEPLLLRLTVGVGSIGRFHLGTLRIHAGVRTFSDELCLNLFEDEEYAAQELRPQVAAEVQAVLASRPAFSLGAHDPQLTAALEQCLHDEPFRLMLDPGHDAEGDRGARGIGGKFEVELNDQMAARIRRRLAKLKNLDVQLSRGPTESLPLKARTARIAEAKPDLVLSIHHDNVRRSRQVVTRHKGRSIRACPARQGFSMYIPMVGAHASPSYQLARHLSAALLGAGRPVGRFFEWGEPRFGIYNGDLLYLIDHARAPTVLLEVGYVCNPDDARLLDSRRFVEAQAREVADAVIRHLYFAHCEGLRMKSPWVAELTEARTETVDPQQRPD